MCKRILIATGTRADWGLLSPVARELRRRGHQVLVLATNMHLDPRYGNTIDEIRADGFEPDACVPLPSGDSALDRARATGVCTEGTADALERLKPDAVVVLGDRYEMLGVASACVVGGVPVVHLHGGEVTLGAIDDRLRHAITKLSTLHLTSTEEYRQRVISMGEPAERVVCTGAIGVWGFARRRGMPLEQVQRQLGIDLSKPTMMVTYHPATLDGEDPVLRVRQLFDALDRWPDHQIIITYPNNDPRSQGIIGEIQAYAQRWPGRVLAVQSLGMARYLTVLPLMKAVVGNSSSGILEAPTAGVPTVNIGDRQLGRTAADSVIHCGQSADEISAAIARALSPDFQRLAKSTPNPYYHPDTLNLITEAICKLW